MDLSESVFPVRNDAVQWQLCSAGRCGRNSTPRLTPGFEHLAAGAPTATAMPLNIES
jgi:hypothetical protein